MSKNTNVSQIIRIDGKNCFLEVINTGFQIGKVFFNFVAYDPNTFKQQYSIPVYIDIPKWLALSEDIKLGIIKRASDTEKSAFTSGQKTGFPAKIFMDLGGTTKESLSRQNKSRPDGKDESRTFSITPATMSKSMDIILQAERGPGEVKENGLIAPKYDYKDKVNYQKIMVSMKHEDLKGLVRIVDMHLQGYINSQWIKGAYTYTPQS